MGQSVSWLSGLLWAKKEIRILILGLVCGLPIIPTSSSLLTLAQDNAGKTTLLYRLKVRTARCFPFSDCTMTDEPAIR